MVRKNYEDGVYTPPKEIEIWGIPTLIVDPHNESFQFWYNSGLKGATLFHIDRHADSADGAPEFKRGVSGYSEEGLSITNFICAAFHYRIISKAYHLEPRKRKVTLYEEEKKGEGVTRTSSGSILWNSNLLISKVNFPAVVDLPLILDIDLDAFECKYDREEFNVPTSLNQVEKYFFGAVDFLFSKPEEYPQIPIYPERIKETMALLAALPKPKLITIARSQTPRVFTPKEKVDDIQFNVLAGLRRVYEGQQVLGNHHRVGGLEELLAG